MKVLAIRGQNLASLAEPFALELDRRPFADAGVFAICGPTGAGKSTLLDALCLALFDAVPRLDAALRVKVGRDEAGEGVSEGDPRSLMRRGAGHAYAEVDFRGIDGRKYRARWEARRARGSAAGRLQPTTMSLVALPARRLAGDRKTEVKAAIEAKLGLSFSQFRRSVLLSQGDVGAFLFAPLRERAELLERMTGTDLFGRISMAAFERSRVAETEVSVAKARMEAVQALAPAARAELEEAKARLERSAAEAELELANARRAVSYYQHLDSLISEEADAREVLAAVSRQLALAEPRRREVEAVEAAEPLRGEVEGVDRAKATRATRVKAALEAEERLALTQRSAEAALRARREARASLAAHETKLSVSRSWLQKTRAAKSALTLAQTQEQEARSQLAEVEAQRAARAAALERGRAEWAEVRREYEEACAWLEAQPAAVWAARHWDWLETELGRLCEVEARRAAAIRRRDEHDEALAQQEAEQERAAAELRDQTRLADTKAAELDAHRETRPAVGAQASAQQCRAQQQAVRALERQLATLRELARLRQTACDHQRREREARTRAAAAEARKSAHAREVERLTGQAEEAGRSVLAARAMLELEDRRHELVEGEPCPLCGATAHPFAAIAPGSLNPALRSGATGPLGGRPLVDDGCASPPHVRPQPAPVAHAASSPPPTERRSGSPALQELLAEHTARERELREALAKAQARWVKDHEKHEAGLEAAEEAAREGARCGDAFSQRVAETNAASSDPAFTAALQALTGDEHEKERVLSEWCAHRREESERLEALEVEAARALAHQAGVVRLTHELDALRFGQRECQQRLQRCTARGDEIRQRSAASTEAAQALERALSTGLERVQPLLALRQKGGAGDGRPDPPGAGAAATQAARTQVAPEATPPGVAALRQAASAAVEAAGHQQARKERAARRRRELEVEAARLGELAAAQSGQVQALTGALETRRRAREESEAELSTRLAELEGLHPDAYEARLLEVHAALREAEASAGIRAEAALQARSGAEASCERERRYRRESEEALADKTKRLAVALHNAGLSEAEVRICLRADREGVRALRRELSDLDRKRAEHRAVLAERARKREAHEADEMPRSGREEASAQLKQAETRVAATREARIRVQSELERDDARQADAADAAEAFAACAGQAAVWAELNGLIGSASGHKFRVFAQSMTLDLLLAHANHHLRDLAPRYRLERVPDEDLALQVVDRDLGADVRSVASLSGGETFLVALGLALGLASLNSDTTRVDSLFIDEGFGALDPDSLELVLSALDALHAQGRQVGLISHVPSVAERFETRVQISPAGLAQSRVRVEPAPPALDEEAGEVESSAVRERRAASSAESCPRPLSLAAGPRDRQSALEIGE